MQGHFILRAMHPEILVYYETADKVALCYTYQRIKERNEKGAR